ncbi:MAG: hypothetical protein ACRBBN_15545 [Methyloligellaceae bacterium]
MSTALARKAYRSVRNVIMERSGLQPKGVHRFSIQGNKFENDDLYRITLPNLSGELRPIMRQYMDCYGMGNKSLLVSENSSVRDVLSAHYPDVTFLVSDYYTELMNDKSQTSVDYVWDVCCDFPDNLKNERFGSILSQSLLEHTIAPTIAITNLLSLLEKGGYLYLSTHTPSFHYHAYPRDYVRFHHDYFYDLPDYVLKAFGYKIQLTELYSSFGVVCVCYRRE